MKTIIGIDPGKTGAICVLSSGSIVQLEKLTTHALCDVCHKHDSIMAVVEHVSAGGVANAEGRRMGATSAFSFGQGFGEILGVLSALDVPYELVRPAKWTAAMGERGKDKDSHWEHARRLYPGAKIFKYACDAVLLAEYGRRFLWREE